MRAHTEVKETATTETVVTERAATPTEIAGAEARETGSTQAEQLLEIQQQAQESQRPAPRQTSQRLYGWLSRRWAPVRRVLRDTEGAATAEYAVVILAAVGFAGLLVLILRSEEVRGMLVDLVQRALSSAG